MLAAGASVFHSDTTEFQNSRVPSGQCHGNGRLGVLKEYQ